MLKLLKTLKRVALRVAAMAAPLAIAGVAGAAAASDLQVSAYTWAPNPVANGARATFTLRATNNGPDPVNDAIVTIAVPSHFSVAAGTFPAYCSLSGAVGGQTLTCAMPPMAGGDASVVFSADATSAGSRTTTASISSLTNVDGNTGNDSLTVSPAVREGADLSVVKDDGEPDNSIPAGGILTYTLQARNAGPDATAAIRVTDNLPAANNFEFISAAGSDWTCSRSGLTGRL